MRIYIKILYFMHEMFTYILNLSHWEAEKAVYITEEHCKDLQDHHLDCLRSLYEGYNKKIKGKLVTYPEGINIAIIIRALLSAIINDLKKSVLIICDPKSICLWHYEMSKITNVIVVNYEKNKIKSGDNSLSIIITTLEKLKESPLDRDFSIIIGEDIETLINKVVFKKLTDISYKIGFSKKEFIDDDELKLLWHIFKWIDSNFVGKLSDFIEIHKEHMNNLRDPYDHIWHRIDWDLPNYDQLELENTEYKALLDEWGDRNNIILKVIPKGGTRSSKRSLGENKSDKKSPQTKKTKNTTNDLNKTISMIHLAALQRDNFITKLTDSERLIENNDIDRNKFEKENVHLKPTKLFENVNDFIGNTSGNKRFNQNKSSRLLKKSKSTINEIKNIEKDSFKNNLQKAKSSNDLDSLQTIFEKDSWIEDYMKDVDVSEISVENDTKETTKIFSCIEDMPFSLSTESKLFTEFSEEFKIVEDIDKSNQIEDFSNLVSSIMTQEDPKIYPILDAIIKGSPLENVVEKYKASQENNRPQMSRERTPSPTFRLTDQEGTEYPILDAIINRSPLKKAIEDYKNNVLGERQFEDDIFNFSCKTDLKTKF